MKIEIIASLVILLFFVGTASAADTYTAFAAYGDAFKSTNDTYTVIKWNTSGARTAWNPTGNVTSDTVIEYVVVGGGGGGGYRLGGGGGGAGGYWEGTLTGITTSQSVTIGAGGAGSAATSTTGTSGGNSIFGSITANGGSGGGTLKSSAPAGASLVLEGGSSGGGGANATSTGGGVGRSNNTNQSGHGFYGGTGYNSSATNYQGGGGGGSFSFGINGTTNKGGDGGNASITNITGTLLTLAGGGGGGTYSNTAGNRGAGGSNATSGVTVGGAGGYRTTAATAATVKTGSGGGGGGSTSNPTAGSDGVIIIRYPTPAAPIANFTANVTSGAVPLPVSFTDTSTNSPTSWNWSYFSKNMLLPEDANGTEIGSFTGTTYYTEDGTKTSTTEQAWEGTHSVKFVTNNAATGETIQIAIENVDTRFTNSTTYVGSAYLRGTGTVTFNIMAWGTGYSYLGEQTRSGITLGDSWQRVNISYTLPDTTSIVGLQVSTASQQLATIYIDGVQLEKGAVPTEWQTPQINYAVTSATLHPSYFSSSQNPVYTFDHVANYTIILDAGNTGGNLTTAVGQKWINVTSSGGAPSAPVAAFTLNRNIARIPRSITCTDTSTNTPTSWQWSWGDGTSNSTDQNPTHTYTKRGKFDIYLTATNAGGSGATATATAVRVVGYENYY
jgi:PKD repeat protein